MEMTFGIIKPDAVKKGHVGAILQRINEKGFKVLGMKMIQLSAQDAGGFYAVHKERPFYNDLVEFMTSGPVVVMALAKDGAVKGWRDLMGATNPKEADEGTIRRDFAESIDANAVHGSDSLENAVIEVSYFFSRTELVNH